MRRNYIIIAAALALSCGHREAPTSYKEAGRLNFPGDSWEPAAAAVAPDGTIYVADASLHSAVQVFAPSGIYLGGIGRLGKSAGELFVPTDVAIGPGGKLYVAEFGTRRVSVYARDGRFLRTLGEGVLTAPFGVAAGPDGTVYVADAEGGGVFIFSPEGKQIGHWGASFGVGEAWDVACAADGRVAVVTAASRSIYLFPPAGGKATKLAVADGAPFTPVEATFGPDGGVIVLGSRAVADGAEEYSVALFSRAGVFRQEVDVSLPTPTALAVAADGTIYVGDGSRHEVKVYKPGNGGQSDRG